MTDFAFRINFQMYFHQFPLKKKNIVSIKTLHFISKWLRREYFQLNTHFTMWMIVVWFHLTERSPLYVDAILAFIEISINADYPFFFSRLSAFIRFFNGLTETFPSHYNIRLTCTLKSNISFNFTFNFSLMFKHYLRIS